MRRRALRAPVSPFRAPRSTRVVTGMPPSKALSACTATLLACTVTLLACTVTLLACTVTLRACTAALPACTAAPLASAVSLRARTARRGAWTAGLLACAAPRRTSTGRSSSHPPWQRFTAPGARPHRPFRPRPSPRASPSDDCPRRRARNRGDTSPA